MKSSHLEIVEKAWLVSMLVYIDLASAVNSKQFLGNFLITSSFWRGREELIHVFVYHPYPSLRLQNGSSSTTALVLERCQFELSSTLKILKKGY